jgi:hypothetical protein
VNVSKELVGLEQAGAFLKEEAFISICDLLIVFVERVTLVLTADREAWCQAWGLGPGSWVMGPGAWGQGSR